MEFENYVTLFLLVAITAILLLVLLKYILRVWQTLPKFVRLATYLCGAMIVVLAIILYISEASEQKESPTNALLPYCNSEKIAKELAFNSIILGRVENDVYKTFNKFGMCKMGIFSIFDDMETISKHSVGDLEVEVRRFSPTQRGLDSYVIILKKPRSLWPS